MLLPASAYVGASRQITSAPADYTSGAYLFRTFCASCHGESGKGDGPIAPALRVATPDLTLLTARANGTFPRRAVYEAIDGRKVPGIHGPSGMPIWGDALRQTQGQDEAIVRRRIDALVLHIESLQAKRP
jgi:mono/diheme cytochrome c family protein